MFLDFLALLLIAAGLLAASGLALPLLLTLTFPLALILLPALGGGFPRLILSFVGTLIDVGHCETPAMI
ncbi:MAG TPA: hypothetical protein VHU43_08795 [Steroidobacteraceae bacterium]|nr:hypothetical protein [Steroidobacteraceae bacterium]